MLTLAEAGWPGGIIAETLLLGVDEVRDLIRDWERELETLKTKREEMLGRAQGEAGLDQNKAAAAADGEMQNNYSRWTGRKLSLPIARKLGIAGA